MSEARIGVVIPAGGCGQRTGIKTPKQFLSVNGHSILSHTVSGFASFPGVAVIVVVIHEDREDQVTTDLGDMTSENDLTTPAIVILPTASETSRHLTIRAGVRELSKHNVSLSVVHDAVRPLVDHKLLHSLLEAASKYGAAGPVTPCVSTVVSVKDNSVLDEVLDRVKLRDSQMPQVFRSDLLLDSYEAADEKDLLHGTECLLLVQKYINVLLSQGLVQSTNQRNSFGSKGYPSIRLIQETDANKLWKITYRKDVLASVIALDPAYDVMMKNNLRVFIEAKEHKSLTKSLRCHPRDVKLSSRCILISRITNLCESLFQDVSINTFESGLSSSFLSTPSSGRDEPKPLSLVIRFACNLEQFGLHVRDLETCMDSTEEPSTQSSEESPPNSVMLTVMEMESSPSSSMTSAMFTEVNNLQSRAKGKINFTFIVYFPDSLSCDSKIKGKEASPSTVKLDRLLTLILLKPHDFYSQTLFVQ